MKIYRQEQIACRCAHLVIKKHWKIKFKEQYYICYACLIWRIYVTIPCNFHYFFKFLFVVRMQCSVYATEIFMPFKFNFLQNCTCLKKIPIIENIISDLNKSFIHLGIMLHKQLFNYSATANEVGRWQSARGVSRIVVLAWFPSCKKFQSTETESTVKCNNYRCYSLLPRS